MNLRSLLRATREGFLGKRNRRRTSARRNGGAYAVEVQSLELRQLLAVAGFHAVVQSPKPGQAADRANIALHWQDSEDTVGTHYEVWINQHVSSLANNARTHYRSAITADDVTQSGSEFRYALPEEMSAGVYTAFVRRHDVAGPGEWHRHSFQIDDDNNPATSLHAVSPPIRPHVTVVREGQAAAGQAFSEGAVRWVGDTTLYDVWLGRKLADGTVVEVRTIRNVPGQSISLREMAIAADAGRTVFYGEIASDSRLEQMESGDYVFYVRGVNAAVDGDRNWIGKGAWSLPVDFRFDRVEGGDAVPSNLTATNSERPTISWSPVPHAEAYLVSLWQGPDYGNHAPVSLRVAGTSLAVTPAELHQQGANLTLQPGDELYVRVRAIGSEGMLEGLRAGNYAAITVKVPSTLSASQLLAPQIEGPNTDTGDRRPVLRWQTVEHATSYEVWFTSLQTRSRMFLATNIHDNLLHLSVDSLVAASAIGVASHSDYSLQEGLADGSYRFWVRAHNAAFGLAGEWSNGTEFTVESTRVTQFDLYDVDDPAALPLASPNLVERFDDNGKQYLLVANGLGESFGASVLARFELDDQGFPARPVIHNDDTGRNELQFADLPMGTNVGDMTFLDDDRLLVLSRGSNELRIVNVKQWRVVSEFQLSHGAANTAPDAMDVEVLSNGQILVVFNRSDRLRVLDVDAAGQLFEVEVPAATETDQGFVLTSGRAMQVSAVPRDNGTYTVFLATPTVAGIVIKTYDPTAKTLTNATDQAANTVAVISRSPFAGPYLGGKLKTVALPNGQSTLFYLSTDRNGFLTWINTQTYEFGFVDLVDHLPDASRDPSDFNYRDPNDNYVDPSRIADVDDSHIAIFSNREHSVLLKVLATPDGRLSVSDSSTLVSGYSGRMVQTSTGAKLISTSGGLHVLVLTELSRNVNAGTWTVGDYTSIPVASPVDQATVLTYDKLLFEYRGSRRSIVEYSAETNQISEVTLPTQFVDPQFGVLNDWGGVAGTYVDPTSKREYIAIHAGRKLSSEPVADEFLLVLDVTDSASPVIHRVYEVDSALRWYSITITDDEIILLDRLSAKMLTFAGWRDTGRYGSTPASVYEFLPQHGYGFGGSRSGRVVVMDDGTRVVLHDTTPDKVFSVFAPGSLQSANPVATVHAHNVGQWIYEMEKFDDDRVIAVTWDAKVVILNIRTGVFETIQQLDSFSDLSLDLYGVRGISFHDGVLSVSSPAFGRIADFQFRPQASGLGFTAELIRIVETPDVVTTLLTQTAQWTLDSGRIVRTSLRE